MAGGEEEVSDRAGGRVSEAVRSGHGASGQGVGWFKAGKTQGLWVSSI